MFRKIKCEEVAQHNNKSSVWMVIRDDVYDVTPFLEEHPGGEDSLLEVAGQDATQAFDDIGHSDDAKELLKKYKIGSLPPGEKMPDNNVNEQSPFNHSRSNCSICSSPSCPFFLQRKRDGGPRTPAASSSRASRSSRPEIKKHDCLSRERVKAPPHGPCRRRDGSGAKWKYILALASVVLIGLAAKKYFTSC